MHAFSIVADWLYGCSHRRTTFPITLRPDPDKNGQQSMRTETYIVCLQCGRHLAYDWTAMRPGMGAAPAEARRGSG